MIKNLQKNSFIKARYYFYGGITIFFLTYIGGTLYESYNKSDQYSYDLSLKGANILETIFIENKSLLRHMGENISLYKSDNFYDQLSTYLKLASELSLESLTTSYVSWANLNGEVIVSGKSGKQFNTKKNIRSRDYYKKLLIKPWELHIANPEKSLFSTKYVLPTAMSVEGKNGKILGILVLGLRVDEINKRINEISLRQGYYINVFDKKRGTYIPSNNTDSKAFDKDVDIDSIKKDLKGFPYSIHVEKKPLLIFLNNLEKYKFLFCLILLLLSIIVFVFESYYRIITTNHDLITFLKKGKTLAETSLSHRERFYKASFNRFDESILDIESCMTFINNYTLDNDLKPIFMRIKDLMFDLRAITKEGKRNKLFDICSLLDESLLYFSSEIFDKNIIVAKSYQKTIPRGGPIKSDRVLSFID